MRAAFARGLTELAARDERLLLLTGDLGYQVLEPFAEQFPRRFFNVGVAEQNMVGLATGLAEAGFIPFVYSIATFASLRPYEFIRNGPVLHRLPVRIIGVGGGYDYGPAGHTHHNLEDLGVLRLQPGLTVIAPADHAQARAALLATWDRPGPIYYRLGKDDRITVPGLEGRFEFGRLQWLREAGEILIIAVGDIAGEAYGAAETLRAQGVECALLLISTINPAPVQELAEALARFSAAVTVEAHYVTGGIGSLVAEVIAEQRLDCRLVRCGIRQPPSGRTGGARFLNHQHGLSQQAMAGFILQQLALQTR
jgi:transketolase